MKIAASVQSQAVFRACQLLGGPEQLAARIGVSRLLIKAILNGCLPTSQLVFLKVVDILAAAEGYETYEAPRHRRNFAEAAERVPDQDFRE